MIIFYQVRCIVNSSFRKARNIWWTEHTYIVSWCEVSSLNSHEHTISIAFLSHKTQALFTFWHMFREPCSKVLLKFHKTVFFTRSHFVYMNINYIFETTAVCWLYNELFVKDVYLEQLWYHAWIKGLVWMKKNALENTIMICVYTSRYCVIKSNLPVSWSI